jgi:hypothetical protein
MAIDIQNLWGSGTGTRFYGGQVPSDTEFNFYTQGEAQNELNKRFSQMSGNFAMVTLTLTLSTVEIEYIDVLIAGVRMTGSDSILIANIPEADKAFIFITNAGLIVSSDSPQPNAVVLATCSNASSVITNLLPYPQYWSDNGQELAIGDINSSNDVIIWLNNSASTLNNNRAGLRRNCYTGALQYTINGGVNWLDFISGSQENMIDNPDFSLWFDQHYPYLWTRVGNAVIVPQAITDDIGYDPSGIKITASSISEGMSQVIVTKPSTAYTVTARARRVSGTCSAVLQVTGGVVSPLFTATSDDVYWSTSTVNVVSTPGADPLLIELLSTDPGVVEFSSVICVEAPLAAPYSMEGDAGPAIHDYDRHKGFGWIPQSSPAGSFYFNGGTIVRGTTVGIIAAGNVALTSSSTNYVYLDTDNVVKVNTTGVYPYGSKPLHTVVVNADGMVTTHTDNRGDLWSCVPAGSNGQVQFNANNLFGASANFIFDDVNNRLSVGGIAAPEKLFVLKNVGDLSTTDIMMVNNISASGSNRIYANKSRGTYAAPEAVAANDFLLTLGGRGYGSEYSSATNAYIYMQAAENFTTTAKGTQIGFGTTVKGTTTQNVDMVLNDKGNLLLGSFATDGWKLFIKPTANTTAGQTVFIQDGTATTGSTKLVIKSGAGQSTNTLEEWQDVSANVMASMSQTLFTSPATLQLKNGTKFNSFTNSASQGAGTLAYTLPSAYPASDGYVLSSTTAGIMSWIAAGGGGSTSPAGSDREIQWNNAGSFGASSKFKFSVTDVLQVGEYDAYSVFTGSEMLTTSAIRLSGNNGYNAQISTTLSMGAQLAGNHYITLPIPTTAPTVGDVLKAASVYDDTMGSYAVQLEWGTGGAGSSPFTEAATPSFSIRRTNESTTGNTRGTKAIDLIYERASAAQVAAADFSGILSGKNHQVDGLRSCIASGNTNRIYSAYSGAGDYDGNSFIGGGYGNIIKTNHLDNTIGGGATNIIGSDADTYCQMSTISGGFSNTIAVGTAGTTSASTIGGGHGNSINGLGDCTIAGGRTNTIGGTYSTCVGATIGGGKSNVTTANCEYGTIPGGRSNSVGSDCFAAGYNATSTINSFCWADGTATTTNRSYQFKVGAAGGFYLRNNAGNFDWYDDGAGKWLSTPNAGCYLGSDGVWYSASSRNVKTSFADIDNKSILQKVIDTAIQEWEYIATPAVKHIGVIAEDFIETFGFGDNPEGLNPLDVCGVLWAAVKELKAELDNSNRQLDKLSRAVFSK